MAIEVGDFVTWRSHSNSLGLTGCKVVRLGNSEDGVPGALIDIGRFAEKPGEPIGVPLAHLHPEG